MAKIGTRRKQISKRTKISTPKIGTIDLEIKRIINEVNRKLRNLKKENLYGHYSSKELLNKLSTNINLVNKQGYIELRDNISTTELVAFRKASEEFIKSKTSTKKGIKAVKDKTIDTLRKTLSTPDVKLTKKQAEAYYNLFKNKNFDDLAQKIGASTLFETVAISKERSFTENDFVEYLEMISYSINDEELQEDARALYKAIKNSHIATVD